MDIEKFQKIMDLRVEMKDVAYTHWIENVVFTWQWWLLLVIFISPLIILAFLINKKEKTKILLLGFAGAIIFGLADDLGVSHIRWDYPYHVFPFVREFLDPIDFGFLPVIYMLFYQYFLKWRTYIIAHVINAAIGSFIIEPLFVKIGIYEMHNWKGIYSFPIYILIGIILKLFVDRIAKTD